MKNLTRDDARARVVAIVCACGEVPAERLRDAESLYHHGIDSLAGVNIAYEIGLLLGRDVPSTLLTECDTVEKLVDYVLAA